MRRALLLPVLLLAACGGGATNNSAQDEEAGVQQEPIPANATDDPVNSVVPLGPGKPTPSPDPRGAAVLPGGPVAR